MLHTFLANCTSEGRDVLRLVRVAGKVTEADASSRAKTSLDERGLMPSEIRAVPNKTTLEDVESRGLPYMGVYLKIGE